MWTRSMLKSNAKAVLRRTYWLSFVVAFICNLLVSGSSLVKMTKEYNTNNILVQPEFILSGSMITFVYTTFIGGALLAGGCYFFMRARQYDADFMDLFKGFTNGSYFHTIGVLLVRQIYVFLWSLLFLIPGIIKSYEYYFVPYIIMENPNITRQRAFELSKGMTKGYKWNIFLLEMSFLGWVFLGLLFCGIGVIFVPPYVEATKAELYAAQRAEVLRAGISNEGELCGFSSNMF